MPAVRSLAILTAATATALLAAGPTPQQHNYDEARVGAYTLPDSLLTRDNRRITTPQEWRATRRGELLHDFRDLMYGHTPSLPIKLRAELTAVRKDAVDGPATRTVATLRFFDDPGARGSRPGDADSGDGHPWKQARAGSGAGRRGSRPRVPSDPGLQRLNAGVAATPPIRRDEPAATIGALK